MIRRGDVYLVDLLGARGNEQRGPRPALVIQNDLGNDFSNTTIIAFMSTRERGYDFHVRATGKQLRIKETSYIMLEQINTVTMERLGRRLGQVDSTTMERVDAALHRSLGITFCPYAP